MEHASLCNKVGALALAINEAMLADADDLAPTAVAALISIRDREPLSIGDIARIVKLTHSAAVRMVDRLEKDWLVRRQRRVSREVMVEITARGRRRAQQLQEARLTAVEAVMGPLEPAERAVLEGLVDRMIAGMRDRGLDPLQHCRMCARRTCTCGLHTDVARPDAMAADQPVRR